MISYIEGKVINLQLKDKLAYADILTVGGVGYRVTVQPGKLLVGETTALYTSFKVREDSQELYGFADSETRDFLELLISVSGVGPKTAMIMLAINSPERLAELIEEGDFKALSKTPGIGEKSAKKIIVELQGKIDLSPAGETDPVLKELDEALTALGYSRKEVEQMVEKGSGIYEEDRSIEIAILIQRVLQ